MPGFLLDAGATIQCLHAGQAQAVKSNPRVKTGGQPVLTLSSVCSISGCTLPPPPTGIGPCLTAQWITAALRVKAGGEPVLLQDSQAMCVPTATGLLVVSQQLQVRGQ